VIRSMGKVINAFRMATVTRDSLWKVRDRDWADFCGKTDSFMKDSGVKIQNKEVELGEVHKGTATLGSGNKTKAMDLGSMFGEMETDTRVILLIV